MSRKYTPVSVNNSLIGENLTINSSDTLWIQLRVKYQKEIVRNQ